MLHEPTMQKLNAMKLFGMAQAFEEQLQQPQFTELNFEDRLTLLVERQWIDKEDRALRTRLTFSGLKQTACIEDIDYRSARGFKRAQIEQLARCEWVRYHQNCIISGPTGVGKSFIGCALAQKACREGYRSLYFYEPKLLRQLQIAQADGSMVKLLKKIARVDLLLIDDWGISKVHDTQHRQLLEILEDRQGSGSTLVTTQFPVTKWHELISDPTVADAIVDRLVHSAHRIELEGESMRRKKQGDK